MGGDALWTAEPSILLYRVYPDGRTHYRLVELNPFAEKLTDAERLNAYARLDVLLTLTFAAMAMSRGRSGGALAVLAVGLCVLAVIAAARPGDSSTVHALRLMHSLGGGGGVGAVCYTSGPSNPYGNWLPGDTEMPCRKDWEESLKDAESTNTTKGGAVVRGVQVPDVLSTYGDTIRWFYLKERRP